MFVLPDWLARVWFGMLRQGGLPAAFAGKSCQQPMLFVLCVINSARQHSTCASNVYPSAA